MSSVRCDGSDLLARAEVLAQEFEFSSEDVRRSTSRFMKQISQFCYELVL